MSDFLQVARHRGVYDPEGRHKTLAELASRYFGSAVEANIESLASFLASKREMFPTVEPREAAYADLVEVIRATLNGIYENPVDPSTKNLFFKFAQALVHLRNRVVVITLNYDLLIDQLLRDTNEWFPIDGYGFDLLLAGVPSALNMLDRHCPQPVKQIMRELLRRVAATLTDTKGGTAGGCGHLSGSVGESWRARGSC